MRSRRTPVRRYVPGAARAPALVEDLLSLAGRTGMREMAARALALRHKLGDASALQAAKAIADEVDNPALASALV
jgi:hypothetical protein